MTTEAIGGSRVDVAVARMERAIGLLEQRLAQRLAEAGAQAGDLVAQDRAQLAADLDHARGRQRELEEAGSQASQALARAIAELQDASVGAEA
jgi:hypothetical protein